jgi:hypothetical protein
MEIQRLAPGMEHSQHSDASAQMLGIGSDLQQRFRSATKETLTPNGRDQGSPRSRARPATLSYSKTIVKEPPGALRNSTES